MNFDMTTSAGVRVRISRNSWRSTVSNPKKLVSRLGFELLNSTGNWLSLTAAEADQLASALREGATELRGEQTPDRYHQMIVVGKKDEKDPFTGPVSYRSHCLECDIYTSAYWEPKDCPTKHLVEE